MARSRGVVTDATIEPGRSSPGLRTDGSSVTDVPLPTSPSPDLAIVELGPGDEPLLQRFFEANAAYFDAVFGEAAGPGAARDEIRELPPDGWSYTRRWLLGYVAADGELAAVADVVSDLLVPGAWHVGLFIVATARHGSGQAALLYRGVESWAAGNGARWLRLGVVQGNVRAERFWAAQGFVETRTRVGVVMGRRTNTLRVLVKPLGGETLAAYLARVPRDRPGGPD